jgi:hypothetical protein
MDSVCSVSSAISRKASFVVASAALGLLLIGIHNVWDSFTHIVVSDSDGDKTKTDWPPSSRDVIPKSWSK